MPANTKTPQMMLNQRMPMPVSSYQTRIGWLNIKKKDKRYKNLMVLLLKRSELKKRPVSCFFHDVLPQVKLTSLMSSV